MIYNFFFFLRILKRVRGIGRVAFPGVCKSPFSLLMNEKEKKNNKSLLHPVIKWRKLTLYFSVINHFENNC